MNSENSHITDAQRIRIDIANKMDLRRGGKRVALSTLSVFTALEAILKSRTKTTNLKCKKQYDNLISYQINNIR